jgi:hypothetical protein
MLALPARIQVQSLVMLRIGRRLARLPGVDTLRRVEIRRNRFRIGIMEMPGSSPIFIKGGA